MPLITSHPLFGNVLLSTQSYSPGHIIHTELPSPKYHPTTHKQSRAYTTLSTNARTAIALTLTEHTLCTQSESPNIQKHAKRIHAEIKARNNMLPQIQLQDAMAVLLNSFDIDDEETAVFHMASKLTHTCFSPNCAFVFREGKGIILATKHIEPNTLLTIQYFDFEHTPTYLRQKRLWTEKGFQCLCEYCTILPDYNRAVACIQQDCAGIMYYQPQSQHWRCGQEGHISDHESVRSVHFSSEETYEKKLEDTEQDPETLYQAIAQSLGVYHGATARAATRLLLYYCTKPLDIETLTPMQELLLYLREYDTLVTAELQPNLNMLRVTVTVAQHWASHPDIAIAMLQQYMDILAPFETWLVKPKICEEYLDLLQKLQHSSEPVLNTSLVR